MGEYTLSAAVNEIKSEQSGRMREAAEAFKESLKSIIIIAEFADKSIDGKFREDDTYRICADKFIVNESNIKLFNDFLKECDAVDVEQAYGGILITGTVFGVRRIV